jgi:hypothetical protein
MGYRLPLAVFVLGLAAACGSETKEPEYVDRPGSAADDTAEPDGGDSGSDTDTDDSGTPVDDTGVETSRFDLGDVRPCESPLPDVQYVEVGEEMGLMPPTYFFDEHVEGGAAAVADFDQDGDIDIMMANRGEPAILFDRVGDVFERIEMPGNDGPIQLSIFDADLDGRWDVAFGGFEPDILLNKAEGWTAVPLPLAPTGDETSVVKSVHPGDLDGDGIMDLYVLMTAMEAKTPAALDFVAMGNGDGTFTVDTTQVPADMGDQPGFDVQWFDWDDDGWWDVYVVNELDSTVSSDAGFLGNFLLRSDGGTMVDATEGCFCDIHHDGMGAHLGDYNRDGWPDLYLAATGNNVLLEMAPDGGFFDVSELTQADPLDGTLGTMAWGAIFLDFDNDGRLDLTIAEGDLWHEFSEDPIVVDLPLDLLRQTETEAGIRFENVSDAYGFGQLGSWRTVVAVDHNGDGVLDPLIGEVENRPLLMMSQGCTANGWIEVDAPMHSRVEVTAGGITQTAWTTTHSSFGGAQPPVAHFGLGANESVDMIRVRLPGGEEVALDAPIAARRVVTVR